MTSEQLKKGKELEDSIAYTKRELKELSDFSRISVQNESGYCLASIPQSHELYDQLKDIIITHYQAKLTNLEKQMIEL